MEKLTAKIAIKNLLEKNGNPLKTLDIIAHLKGLGLSIKPRRLRQVIHELRAEIPFLMSTSKGYCIGWEVEQVFDAIKRLDTQIQSMIESRNILSSQLEKETGLTVVRNGNEYEILNLMDIPPPPYDEDGIPEIFSDIDTLLQWENRDKSL